LNRLPRWSLCLLIAAPAIFLVVAIQASAITVPFWDHCDLIRVITDYLDGHLSLADLWRPHNHSRPLTYRAIYLINAVLTHWDVRSEFVIHTSTILAAFLLQGVTLWRLCGKRADTRFLIWLLLLSIVAFSPVGHNIHWWSLMSILTLCHLFCLYALIEISFSPQSWRANILAAIACWLATYTLTNGLIAFVCCAGIVQFCSDRPWRPSRWTVFWAFNLLSVAWLYLPGLPSDGGHRPGPLQFIWFSIVYLGAPLRGLLHYPYLECFYAPVSTIAGGITGLLLLAFGGALLFAHREQLRRKTPGALIAASFLGFAMLSAAMTAWGRANFDAAGVSNANASRYTLFGGYFIVGLLLFLASLGPDALRHPIFTRWIPASRQPLVIRIALVLFLFLATVSYARSIEVYRSARLFNSMVIDAYLASPGEPTLEGRIFPNQEFVARLKKDLQRHHLGPYREMAPSASSAGPLVLTSATAESRPEPVARNLTGKFTCPVDVVTGIDVLLCTYGHSNSGYCRLDVLNEAGQRLAWSRTDASMLRDVEYQTFAFNDLADVRGQTLRLVLSYHTDPRSPGMVAAKVPENSEPTFNFRVRGMSDPIAEFARREQATQK